MHRLCHAHLGIVLYSEINGATSQDQKSEVVLNLICVEVLVILSA